MSEHIDATRRLLKVFGIAVTNYEEQTRALIDRRRNSAPATDQDEDLQREVAQLTADLHKALREITNHVYQLQSDALMQLVAKPPRPAP